jgi:hypothetical protein
VALLHLPFRTFIFSQASGLISWLTKVCYDPRFWQTFSFSALMAADHCRQPVADCSYGLLGAVALPLPGVGIDDFTPFVIPTIILVLA